VITDYASLIGAVAEALPRSDVAANIPVAVALAEAQINRSIRNRQQEQRATATVTEYVEFPTDYLEIRDIQLNVSSGHKTLYLVAPSELDKYSGATGEPAVYSLIANQIQFGPAPDGTYTCEIVYRKKVPALTGSASTNWFLTDHPDCYLAGVKYHVLQMLDDPKAGGYLTLFMNLLDDVNRMDRQQRWSGPPMAVRVA
jgi:hypothetical protein